MKSDDRHRRDIWIYLSNEVKWLESPSCSQAKHRNLHIYMVALQIIEGEGEDINCNSVKFGQSKVKRIDQNRRNLTLPTGIGYIMSISLNTENHII